VRAETRSAVMIGLACVLVAPIAIGVIRGRAAASELVRGVRTRYAIDLDATEDRAGALARTVDVVRRRIDARGLAAAVRTEGETLVVEASDRSPEALATLAGVVVRVAKLRFVVVASGSAEMRRIAAHAESAPDPRAVDVLVEEEEWITRDGTRHTDVYLRGIDRPAMVTAEEARELGCVHGGSSSPVHRCTITGRRWIERYLRDVTAQDPTLALPRGQRIGYQYVELDPTAPPYWRTYVLDRERAVDGDVVADATVVRDSQTRRPKIQLQLTAAASRAFADLTRANVGRRLAIELDDRITSAPVIDAPIAGGRIAISVGGTTREAQETEAIELAAVLRGGSLPAAMLEERREDFERPGKSFLGAAWIWFAIAGGLLVALAGWFVTSRRPV
jgi:preprotein translocase subunit SecD